MQLVRGAKRTGKEYEAETKAEVATAEESDRMKETEKQQQKQQQRQQQLQLEQRLSLGQLTFSAAHKTAWLGLRRLLPFAPALAVVGVFVLAFRVIAQGEILPGGACVCT